MTEVSVGDDGEQKESLDESLEQSDRAYLEKVMAEIDEEVRRRRESGELPERIERQLDELFLAHSPVTSHKGGLSEALGRVDSSAFIDPVVPISSSKSGGAVVKKGIRSLSLWYIGYVTHQVSQFAASVSRSLHLIEKRLDELDERADASAVPHAAVVESPWAQNLEGAWWLLQVTEVLQSAPKRVVHASAGNGWLVRHLCKEHIDAYGVEERPLRDIPWDDVHLDMRDESIRNHLTSVGRTDLGGVVLTGVTDGMTVVERMHLVYAITDRLCNRGVLVVHSYSPEAWSLPQAPVEADLCPGHPWKLATWHKVLSEAGFEVQTSQGPSGNDYLVVATLVDRSPIR